MITLAHRLRRACDTLRRTSVPLSELIPLMQKSADKIDETQKQIFELLAGIRRHT